MVRKMAIGSRINAAAKDKRETAGHMRDLLTRQKKGMTRGKTG